MLASLSHLLQPDKGSIRHIELSISKVGIDNGKDGTKRLIGVKGQKEGISISVRDILYTIISFYATFVRHPRIFSRMMQPARGDAMFPSVADLTGAIGHSKA